MAVKKRIKELEELIKLHKAKYYQGSPTISDADFDKLELELKEIDPGNQVLFLVGTSPRGANKVHHETKMLSLNKTYNIDELLAWKGDNEVISTFKIDGVSCSLVYEQGVLAIAKTRGDGSIGENITDKAIWMQGVPTTVATQEKFEVRGEVFCTEESFFHLSDEMERLGFERPTSQRNIVAGLIGRKENIELCRYIEFRAFDMIEDKQRLEKECQKEGVLKKLGFVPEEMQVHKNKQDIERRLKESQQFMSEGDYQIDGLVFSFNELALHEELGNTAHHPRYKMAFKFQGEAKPTVIKEITWQVSRNGILTPIANVKPVELSGARISRVTLHNFGMIKQYNLKKGDTIEIIRSGEVIPKFMSVIVDSGGKYAIPQKCPSCEGPIRKDDIRLRCDNDQCPAQLKESILNFIVKIGIDDLSSKRLDELIKAKLVSSIPDLYRVKKEELLELEKVKDKLATKLLSSIEKSKEVTLPTFLASLGIPGGAFNRCEKVVLAGYNTIEEIKNLTIEKLQEIEGFAEKSATEFFNGLMEKKTLIDELLALGFNFEKTIIKDSQISKKKICITGSLSRKRSEIEGLIRDNGGIIVSSVSKNTDYLLTNEKEGESSKFKKAISLGITIISEEALLTLIGR